MTRSSDSFIEDDGKGKYEYSTCNLRVRIRIRIRILILIFVGKSPGADARVLRNSVCMFGHLLRAEFEVNVGLTLSQIQTNTFTSNSDLLWLLDLQARAMLQGCILWTHLTLNDMIAISFQLGLLDTQHEDDD